MLEKVEFTFHVEFTRKGGKGEIIGGSNNISVARTLFFAEVDSKGATLHRGDALTLQHGARVILTYPPEQPKW